MENNNRLSVAALTRSRNLLSGHCLHPLISLSLISNVLFEQGEERILCLPPPLPLCPAFCPSSLLLCLSSSSSSLSSLDAQAALGPVLSSWMGTIRRQQTVVSATGLPCPELGSSGDKMRLVVKLLAEALHMLSVVLLYLSTLKSPSFPLSWYLKKPDLSVAPTLPV